MGSTLGCTTLFEQNADTCQYREFLFLAGITKSILGYLPLSGQHMISAIGNLVAFRHCQGYFRSICQYQVMFVLIRAIDDYFFCTIIRVKKCYERQIFVMEGECMLWKANSCHRMCRRRLVCAI